MMHLGRPQADGTFVRSLSLDRNIPEANMGDPNVRVPADSAMMRRFSRHLIDDINAMEAMLAEGCFEQGITRIGAEQEVFLVDPSWQPVPMSEQYLEALNDPDVVSELARFNLEFNLPPVEFVGSCLSQLQQALDSKLDDVVKLGEQLGSRVVLTGILPTIHLSDLTLDKMTPNPRYFALNEAISRLRGGPARYHIRGVDELFVKHDSILLEACNTSFQTHFQVAPEDFARHYNIAQLVAAPVLAAAVNSPVFFGKRLWRETRIALFQQAVDTRSSNLYLREMSPRVHFGSDWVQSCVTEIFKEDIARFRVLLADDFVENSLLVREEGRVPLLRALQLHNGTVYRWNRACYGITDGKPHLRIENRILPSGPTTVDEVANAAFWFGLVCGLASTGDDVADLIDFDMAKSNFVAAARLGLGANLVWFNGETVPVARLVRETLLPIAEKGLRDRGLDERDIRKYLNIIDRRVEKRMTGANWQLQSLAAMRGKGSRAQRLNALVAGMYTRQRDGAPVHEWSLAELFEGQSASHVEGTRVEHFMTTDLFTVDQEELIEFVSTLMEWRRIRHVPVEDDRRRLVGLVSYQAVQEYLACQNAGDAAAGRPIKDIMMSDPLVVSPQTTTTEAIRLLKMEGVGALPVVRNGRLLGIITEADIEQGAHAPAEANDDGKMAVGVTGPE
jgi:CBS domain-containing protein